MKNNMKKFFKAAGKIKQNKVEAIVFNVDEHPEKVFERLTKTFKADTTKVCEHQATTGKTVLLILKEGLVEMHEIIQKNYTYISFQSQNKKIFKKYEKSLLCKI